MQYILSEEEMAQMRQQHQKKLSALEEKLLEACVLAAKNTIRNEWGAKGCTLDESAEDCECPVEHLCPYEYKRYPK